MPTLKIKNYFLIIFLIAICNGALAQNFGGGAYGGLTSTQIDGDGVGGFDLWGGYLGVFTSVPLGANSDLLFELSFIQKGSRQVPDSANNFAPQFKIRTNYIEIPLLYRLYWNKISLEIGPALDILVYNYQEANYLSYEEPDYLPLHLTLLFGVNYHFHTNWHVNFRTNVSVTPAHRGSFAQGVPGVPSFGGGGLRHVVLSTALVYTFGD